MCNGVAMSVAADWLAVMMPGVFCISDSTYLHVARRVLMGQRCEEKIVGGRGRLEKGVLTESLHLAHGIETRVKTSQAWVVIGTRRVVQVPNLAIVIWHYLGSAESWVWLCDWFCTLMWLGLISAGHYR